MPKHALKLAAVYALACLVIGFFLGDNYIKRLTNHDGYFLVHVEDPGLPGPSAEQLRRPRPRRTFFIVVDGLRRDSAETMASAKRIAAKGQCRISDQGPYTVSRPVYSLLSTGLEVDRSGARNNDNTLPLRAESFWEVARLRGGYRVFGSSHLPWFKQLFPNGFDEFRHLELHEKNIFAVDAALLDRFDVFLFHPLYVDEAGHHFGAASPNYRAAVERADKELAELLDQVDFDRDLVVLTADHGHRDQGGHGGAQPEIENVLLCLSGPNIAKAEGRPMFDGRVTAPLMSVLLGLPFPAEMRAGEDSLDSIWEITTNLAPAYIDNRKAAVEVFRAKNQAALAGWGGTRRTWSELYDRERGAQERRTMLVTLVALLILGLRARRCGPSRRAIALSVGWIAATFVLVWLAHHAVLGDFDYTVINLRARYVPAAFLVIGASTVIAFVLHFGLHRSVHAILRDFATVTMLLLTMNLGHIFIYKWPLGFPLPSHPARYFPFFGSIAQIGFALVMFLLVVAVWRIDHRKKVPPGR